jgi:cell division transport system permease protein
MSKKKNSHISTLGSRLTSVISVTLVLVILGILALTAVGARSVTNQVKENLTVIVKMAPETSEDDINNAKHQILTQQYIAAHTFLSADMVLAQEVEYIGDETVNLMDENPYGAEFELRLKPAYANPDSLASIQNRLAQLAGVDEIITNATVAQNVDQTIEKLTLVMLSIAAALLAISLVLIHNTVSLSIYSRRFIIHTMKLVGATASFIRRPFIRAGAAIGAVSGVAASAIIAGAHTYLVSVDPDVAVNIPLEATLVVYGALILLGIIVCSLTSMWSANRYIRKNFDQLFKK